MIWYPLETFLSFHVVNTRGSPGCIESVQRMSKINCFPLGNRMWLLVISDEVDDDRFRALSRMELHRSEHSVRFCFYSAHSGLATHIYRSSHWLLFDISRPMHYYLLADWYEINLFSVQIHETNWNPRAASCHFAMHCSFWFSFVQKVQQTLYLGVQLYKFSRWYLKKAYYSKAASSPYLKERGRAICQKRLLA